MLDYIMSTVLLVKQCMPVELHDSSIASWGGTSFGQDGPYIFTSLNYCKLLNQDAESVDCFIALGISDTGELCSH